MTQGQVAVAQFETKDPKLIRVRSAFDPRWILAMAVGVVLSLGYYGLLLWAVVAIVRWLVGF